MSENDKEQRPSLATTEDVRRKQAIEMLECWMREAEAATPEQRIAEADSLRQTLAALSPLAATEAKDDRYGDFTTDPRCDGCGCGDYFHGHDGWAKIFVNVSDEKGQKLTFIGFYCPRCKGKDWAYRGHLIPAQEALSHREPFKSIEELIAEYERDPTKKAALDKARAEWDGTKFTTPPSATATTGKGE